MSDIVERLRAYGELGNMSYMESIQLKKEAADEIERLRAELSRVGDLYDTADKDAAAEIERLREALEIAIREASQHDSDEACLVSEIERLRAEPIHEETLADFICDEQDRIGPGCDELALAQTLLRKFKITPREP